MSNFLKFLLGTALTSSACIASAQEVQLASDKMVYPEASSKEPAMFRLSGFGTLGVARSNNTNADFSSTVFHPTGTGYTRSSSADVDSKLGVQINAELTNDLSAVLQLVSQQNYKNSYVPAIEWANLSYKVTSDVTLRVGRTMWPLLLRSETQNIGYGNPFVRNSTELMATMPNTFSDGIDLTYRFPVGPAINSLTFLIGKSNVNYPGSGSNFGQNYLHVKDIKGISDVLELGDWKFHVAYMKLKYDWLYFDFLLNGVPYQTWSSGFNYDPGKWFITADLLKVNDKSYGNFTALTAGMGYRFGDWTPYVQYSSLTQDRLGNLGSVGSHQGDKQTVQAIGVRWDFMKNADLKLQYERVRSGAISQIFPSSLTNWQPNFINNPNANIVSLVVDFVF